MVSRPTESDPWSGSVSAKAPIFSSAGHRGQPLLLLLLRAQHGDRLHGQPGLDPDEGGEATVATTQLHVDQPDRERVEVGTAVPDDPVADDAQRAELLDQRPGELGPLPVAVDHRKHLLVDEGAGALEVAELARASAGA